MEIVLSPLSSRGSTQYSLVTTDPYTSVSRNSSKISISSLLIAIKVNTGRCSLQDSCSLQLQFNGIHKNFDLISQSVKLHEVF